MQAFSDPSNSGTHPPDYWRPLLLFLIGLTILPALTINLGALAFIDDEGIRSQVAYEMMTSGNYIQSTINGEAYFKKPPLYNWILAGVFTATGTVNEWTARLTTVGFLLLFCWLIYAGIVRATRDKEAGLMVALMTLTCGRILFWDSFLGLIDICFSLIIFLQFLWMYFTWQRGRLTAFFIGAWSLTVVSFMLKGLPGPVFLVCTLAGLVVWNKAWRRIFHPGNFIGASLFALFIGGYYYLLFRGADAATVFQTLFHESTQRTPVEHGLIKTLTHIVSFPFEMVYHFLPWSLLVFFIWPLRNLRERLQHPFIRFTILFIAVNIPVYWLSPQVYPRYLLMFAPMFFLVGWWLYKGMSDQAWMMRGYRNFFTVLGILPLLVSWLPFVLQRTADTPYLVVKTALLMALLGLCAWVIVRYRSLLFYGWILQLLVLRLAFDWFVIPDRVREDIGTVMRSDAQRIGHLYKDKPLYFLGQPSLAVASSFYLTTARDGVVAVEWDEPRPGIPYIVHRNKKPDGFIVLDSIRVRNFHDPGDFALLIQYSDD